MDVISYHSSLPNGVGGRPFHKDEKLCSYIEQTSLNYKILINMYLDFQSMILDNKLLPFACVLHIKSENQNTLKDWNEYYSGDYTKVNE